MYTYIWIEGWDNLKEFCQKRFNDYPYMCECSGHCGGARIHEIYKEDKDGHYLWNTTEANMILGTNYTTK